ncbi:hypothetical protein [Paenibacillus sp. Soil766]|uniref:hypothetical protein n=1 Tax=Paenibacillus sp. Soil766 TaxID=1736404 RepID=UPI0012F9D9EA|nr:hypothetical protein [Paenibacillus sp. Soil766]
MIWKRQLKDLKHARNVLAGTTQVSAVTGFDLGSEMNGIIGLEAQLRMNIERT